jgi:N-acetylneuraminic acid mutarotase
VRSGGRSFVVGGYDGTRVALPEVLSSLHGRRWKVVASLPVPVRYPATVAAGGVIWVFGGERAGVMVDVVQRIDPKTGTARVVAHLPTPLGHSSATRLGGRLLVAGGRTSADGLTSKMWWYRPGHGFTPAGRLPTPLADAAVVNQDARTSYLIGGETPGLTDRVVRLSYR